jgi:hypothetical protein
MTYIVDLELGIQRVRKVPVKFTEKNVTRIFPQNDRRREFSASSIPLN